MPVNEAIGAILPVIAVFERLGVPYYIGGSLASSAHGVMRASVDADLIAEVKLQHVDVLVDSLGAEYYIEGRMIREAISARSCFNLIHFATSFKIDVFVPKERAYDRSALARRTKCPVDADSPEIELFLATPEDTVLAKLEWYRLGDEMSDRQWNDILGVLKLQRDRLDFNYMRHCAAELRVDDLLDRATREANDSDGSAPTTPPSRSQTALRRPEP